MALWEESANDPKLMLDVVLSAIELGGAGGEGNRAVNIHCDGPGGPLDFDDIAGQ